MEKFKFRQNFKGIIGLFQELQIGHVISIKDEKGNIIKFADFLAECCAYIINENLFDKAKELLKYQQLMYDVYAYCQSDKASTQAKEMDKECDFIGCFYILDDLKDWLRTESVDKQKDVSSKEFPEELNTDRAREYFKRAVEAGFMEKTDTGYNWLFGGSKGQARLGYFLSKVYKSPRPINYLERCFNVKKLSSSISMACYEAKRNDVKLWRKEIDNNIFFD